MAGIYPDIPATRFALDQDGTIAKYRNISTASNWTDITASLSNVIDAGFEDYMNITGINRYETWELALAFPESRTINGMFGAYKSDGGGEGAPVFYYSTDTTDGTDGTWNTFTGPTWRISSGILKPYYRTDIGSFGPLTNVSGLRIRQTHPSQGTNTLDRIFALHIYGSRPIVSVDRLAFWDPTVDQALTPAYLDFGDHPQGTTTTRQFRIKNLSGTLTANTITVAVNDLDNEFAGNVLLSLDNTNYLASINIGNLAAGVISATLYVRRVVPGAETPNQRTARLLANATTWS